MPDEPHDESRALPPTGGAADLDDEAPDFESGGRGPHFCTDCGAAWQRDWEACQSCADVANRRHAAAKLGQGGLRSIVSALALYFAILMTTIIAIVVDALIGDDEALHIDMRVTLGVEVLASVIVLVWCLGSWAVVRPAVMRCGAPKWYLLAAVLPLITFAAASAAVILLVRYAGAEEFSYSEPILEAGLGWPVVILSICVQPCIIEELAFRGVILSGLRRILDVREAVVVSALLFMFIHLAVLSFPHLFLIGLILGYLRVKTGSIYPCMLAHFLHNLLVVLAEMYLG